MRDPNIMKKRDKGIRLMSTRDVGHRPELREQEVDVKEIKIIGIKPKRRLYNVEEDQFYKDSPAIGI